MSAAVQEAAIFHGQRRVYGTGVASIDHLIGTHEE
jgi:hypothetical protein